MRWGDFALRLASAVVLAPVGLAAIWYGGRVWEGVLAVIVAGLGTEWAGLCGIGGGNQRGLLVPVVLLLAGCATSFLSAGAGALTLVAGAVAAGLVSGRRSAVAGILYIGLAYLALLLLRHGSAGFADVLLVVLVVWGCDIGAYLVGRLVGGPPLAPRLSPSKTWSGAIGGLAFGTLTGVAVALGCGAGWPEMAAAGGIAAALSVVSQAGDMLESAIKRHFGKKDSGWIIPGHGGLLDRLDGLIAAAPVALVLSFAVAPTQALWDWGKP